MPPIVSESQTVAVYTEHNEFDITVTRIIRTPNQKTHQLIMRWLKDENGCLTAQECFKE